MTSWHAISWFWSAGNQRAIGNKCGLGVILKVALSAVIVAFSVSGVIVSIVTSITFMHIIMTSLGDVAPRLIDLQSAAVALLHSDLGTGLQKFVDLLCIAACLTAIRGFFQTTPATALRHRGVSRLRRIAGRLGARPFHANPAGFTL